ncbi:MAG: hypothetical protein WCQ21_08080, partial [Verrucomicrobiota bacterium]
MAIPKRTDQRTAAELAQTVVDPVTKRTQLHEAAKTGFLPPDTTTSTMAFAKDRRGWSALHEGGEHGHLAADVTYEAMAQTVDSRNRSAWDVAAAAAKKTPLYSRLLTAIKKGLGLTYALQNEVTDPSSGKTALHNKAQEDKVPPGTTIDELAKTRDKTGWSALHEALANGHIPPNATLTQLGNCKDNRTHSALDAGKLYATTHPEFATELAEFERAEKATTADLAGRTVDPLVGTKALHIAAVQGKLPPNTTALDLARAKDAYGYSALDAAAAAGSLPKSATLDDLIRCKDKTGHTAFHTAAKYGNAPQNTWVEDFVQCQDERGYSALHAAADGGQIQKVRFLTLEALANCKDANGISALDVAHKRAEKDPQLKAFLKDLTHDRHKGKSPSKLAQIVLDPTGWTALHEQARTGRLPPGTTIADLKHCVDQRGVTALHAAAASGQLPKGTTTEDLAGCKDKLNNSALRFALQFGHVPPAATVEQLVQSRNNDGKTALTSAAYSGHYPPGTTIYDLSHYHELTQAVQRGTWPPDTTAPQLARLKTAVTGEPALYTAAKFGHLPDNTTLEDLQHCCNEGGHTALEAATEAAQSNYQFRELVVRLPEKRAKSPADEMAQTVLNETGYTALHQAAAAGTTPPNTTLQDLIDCRDNNGRSALHDAAAHGHLPPNATAEVLSRCKNYAGRSALGQAVEHGHIAKITGLTRDIALHTDNGWLTHLLAKDGQFLQGMTVADLASVRTGDRLETSALASAINNGHLPPLTTAQDLIAAKDANGNSGLHLAAAKGILPEGTTFNDLRNCRDNKGRSALDTAKEQAAQNQTFALQLVMLSREGKLTATDLAGIIINPNTGQTALHAALAADQLPSDTTAQDLASARDNNGISALSLAAQSGKLPPGTTAQDLANDKRNDGYSALHTAVLHDHLPLGTTAMDLANVQDKQGTTALHIAALGGKLPPGTTVADLANTKDNQGTSALQAAASHDHLPPGTTAAHLANDKDKQGWSALHVVAGFGTLPAGTTLEDLAHTKYDHDGTSALDIANHRASKDASFATVLKALPQSRNTAAYLATQIVDPATGRTALHDAAKAGTLPPGTTLADLANTKNNNGYSALHAAASSGKLPSCVTVADLINTKDN